MEKKPCVLIPSYNEANTIGAIIKRLKGMGLYVYVVDDGSTDETAAMAKAEGAVVMIHSKNMGKGAAMRDGFRRILWEEFETVVVMDGDDQHEIEDIEKLVKKMDETKADMIVGNRMGNTASMPRARMVTNHFMSILISLICGQYVPDTQCGFRLMKTALLRKITLESSNYEIESEMIIKAAHAGFKIGSADIATVYRNEKSRINPFIDTIRFILLLTKIMLKKREVRPHGF